MAPRSGWKGHLRLSLVSIPVKAYTAVNSCSNSGGITLNQLHEPCHSRIRYVKTCPIHGEIPAEEIVSGYEYAKGQYAVIDPDELDQLRSSADRDVTVEAVLSADEIDPLYLGSKTQYLVPDGPVGQQAYNLVQQGLAQGGLVAIAQVVLNGKEETVVLRAASRLIAMTTLNYDAEVTHPSAFEEELSNVSPGEQEAKLARTLLGALRKKKFDITEYRDQYTDRLRQLVEAKVNGQELVSPPERPAAPMNNLMDALRLSVERTQAKDPTGDATKRKGTGKGSREKADAAPAKASPGRRSSTTRAASKEQPDTKSAKSGVSKGNGKDAKATASKPTTRASGRRDAAKSVPIRSHARTKVKGKT